MYKDYTCTDKVNIFDYDFVTPNGPWVVGSYALWHLIKLLDIKEPEWTPNNIDIVVRNEKQYAEVYNLFKDIDHTTSSLKTVTFNTQPTQILLIHKFYNNFMQRLDTHEYNVCRVGYDGERLWYHKDALLDIQNKTLTYIESCDWLLELNQTEAVERRRQKYIDRGFTKLILK
mgnify:CR=1 FL=1|tara:strand:+ start:5887 stop:6405 length:519 start_codon:yes stop_codon:yes gene_type:complete